jgi:hypothetical protein
MGLYAPQRKEMGKWLVELNWIIKNFLSSFLFPHESSSSTLNPKPYSFHQKFGKLPSHTAYPKFKHLVEGVDPKP